MTRRIVAQLDHQGHGHGQPASPSLSMDTFNRSLTSEEPSSQNLPVKVFSTAYGIDIYGPGYQDKRTAVAAAAAAAAATKRKSYIIINADLLIPGDGEPSPHRTLVVENKIIAWIGPQSDVPDKYTTAPHRTYNVPYLMPGLWDVHVHFMGDGPSDLGLPGYLGFIGVNPATAGARLSRGCWEAIQRGYTSLRDVAGFGCEVAKAIQDGDIVGPNIYSAGACLSQTAGHGDVFSMPPDVLYQQLGVSEAQTNHSNTKVSCIVDGVDEVRRAVRLQLRRGARSIKVLASGGVMSRDDDLQYAQFSEEELRVIVEEAGRQGRSVAAHAHGKAGILAAVRAGVHTVEHLSFADQECIDLIKAKGTICVPTRFVTVMLLSTGGEGLEPSVWEKAKLAAAEHLTAYKLAVAAGCTIAMGTDTPPGVNTAKELEYAVYEAGMSSLEAIKAATVNGALTVGAQAPLTGQLKVGYEADLLGVMENPVKDVRVLQDKANIKWVWKGGKLFKGPEVGPWGEDPWWQDMGDN